MLQAIHNELTSYVNYLIADGTLNADNVDDWHFHAFNEDYYIIGYHQAEQWLIKHGLSAWDVIKEVQDYEQDHFGKTHTGVNAESMVNMYVYILGKQIIQEIKEEKDLD
jgi:hypothetical protein